MAGRKKAENAKSEIVTERSPAALLIIDVITDFDFPDGDHIREQALKILPDLASLVKDARSAEIPVIYINDNFGKWQEDFKTTVKYCLRAGSKGKKFVSQLKPASEDYYILKPQRSAFYKTTLDLLLEQLGAETLIIAGLTTDICIFFSANDAYMRNFNIIVPQDCVCALNAEINTATLKTIERILDADIRVSGEIDLKKLTSGKKK